MIFKVTTADARTLSWWHDQKEEIDFDPAYQRNGRAWSNDNKLFLIDSILNNFDMPKLYLADFTFANTSLNVKSKKYAVIDGKQRFEAMFDFFENSLALPKGFIFTDDPSLEIAGLSFYDLRNSYPKIARRYENYNLPVMSVITDDESKINDLFIRLNSSKPLLGAELRNALPGPVPDLIRAISDHPFFKGNIKFDTRRSQDKNTAAKLLLVEHRGRFVDTKKRSLDKLVTDLRVDDIGQKADLDASEEDVGLEFNDAEAAIESAIEDTSNANIDRSTARVLQNLTRMAGIFMQKDPTLNSQTQIIPYYWLCRETDDGRLNQLRSFLARFASDLSEKRNSDPEFREYYTLSRTADDAGSMRERYKMLRRRFDEAYPVG
jgi:hypothetical protein